MQELDEILDQHRPTLEPWLEGNDWQAKKAALRELLLEMAELALETALGSGNPHGATPVSKELVQAVATRLAALVGKNLREA